MWEFPVRMYHWVNVLCIIALCITGYLIGNPLAIHDSAEASFSYWFAINRFIHFGFAYLFFFNFVGRLYWGFVGNKYARWYNFIPLKKEQWIVSEAENGQVALERVSENRPDLILLDLLMPVMDGFQFVRELHRKEAWRSIPIIVITGMTLTELA